MRITSPAFADNQTMPSKYTCDGENFNPPLLFSGVPAGAKSLALVVDDPDAPAGTWTHWTLWNIDPLAPSIDENSKPAEAVEGQTSFGRVGWGGPCPPSGTHRYFFKLFALDEKLNLASGAALSDLEQALQGHLLEQCQLVGLYKRR